MDEIDDEIDTLRLPAVARSSIDQKKSRPWQDTGEQSTTLSTGDRFQEANFFDFDTIPRSKVVLPVLDDELEDTLRLRAVARPLAAPLPAYNKTKAWITTDGRCVILARILRMFGFGFSSVLIGVTLATAGLLLVP